MDNSSSNRQETVELAPVSLEELSLRLDNLRENEYTVLDNGEVVKAISKIREEFVTQLSLEKERFNRVFKTANGSTYFQLVTGQTLRAKMIPDQHEFMSGEGNHFKFQPIMRELFFVSQGEVDRLVELLKENDGEYRPGEVVTVTEYGLEVSPFELNLVRENDGAPQIVFEKRGNKLFLNRSERKDLKGNLEILKDELTGGIHLGHPIIEVLK